MLDLIRNETAITDPLRYDYSQVDEAHREQVMEAAVDIKRREHRAAMDIVEIGRSLIDVRDRLPYGQFVPWLETEFGWQKSMAYNFMAVAESFPKFGKVENFGLSALYLLSGPNVPDEAVTEANEVAERGERVTHKAAKAIVDRHRPKPANASSVSVPLARVLGKCRLCGAGLTDPESVARGYGPECADRMARAAQQDAYKGSDGQAMIEASEAYAAATLAAMAAGQTPPDVAAAMVEPDDAPTALPGAAGAWVRKFGPVVPAGALGDDGEAPPVLPVDLVALGCRLAVEDGFYHVRYGSHRSEYASFEGAVAWCRRITGTDGTTQQGTRQERIAGLLALYQQVLELLPDYGALTGDFTGALPLRRVLEPMVTRLEANATKGAAS